MRKLIPLALFALVVAGSASAQNASLNTPATRTSIAKIVVGVLHEDRDTVSATVTLFYLDASDNKIPGLSQTSFPAVFAVPSTSGQAGAACTTTLAGLNGAIKAARSGEPAGNNAAVNFRILGYLIDQSCFPFAVTLNAS